MAWITPITNWVASDGVAYTDLNRIEGNSLYLYQTLFPTTGGTITGDVTINSGGTISQLALNSTTTTFRMMAYNNELFYFQAGTNVSQNGNVIFSGTNVQPLNYFKVVTNKFVLHGTSSDNPYFQVDNTGVTTIGSTSSTSYLTITPGSSSRFMYATNTADTFNCMSFERTISGVTSIAKFGAGGSSTYYGNSALSLEYWETTSGLTSRVDLGAYSLTPKGSGSAPLSLGVPNRRWTDIWVDGSSFGGSNTTGYNTLTNGQIIQWGKVTPTSTTTKITLPVEFPNAAHGAFAMSVGTNFSNQAKVSGLVPYAFFIETNGTGYAVYWMAFGN